ncbi:hypothetical protein EON80_16800 [bacterium]|nr:MAG: hypothetical protein EON80_16800 [bacterium]
MSFAAKIDGSDSIHIEGDKVWYIHHDWDLPGRNGGTKDPTYINGAEWQPNWDGNNSDKFTLTSPLPSDSERTLKIDVLKLGGDALPRGKDSNITIRQNPIAANNYHAVLHIDDNNDPGAHWFIFSVSWSEENRVAN